MRQKPRGLRRLQLAAPQRQTLTQRMCLLSLGQLMMRWLMLNLARLWFNLNMSVFFPQWVKSVEEGAGRGEAGARA